MGRFLDSLPSHDTPMIVDAGSGSAIASSVEIAITRRARRRGLLGRDTLDAGSALVLAPCWTVHTVGMRFPIDVLFVDGDGVVLKIVERMTGWRMAAEWSAAITIELWAGAVQAVDVHVGDRLCFAPAFPKARTVPASALVSASGALPASTGIRQDAKESRAAATCDTTVTDAVECERESCLTV